METMNRENKTIENFSDDLLGYIIENEAIGGEQIIGRRCIDTVLILQLRRILMIDELSRSRSRIKQNFSSI